MESKAEIMLFGITPLSPTSVKNTPKVNLLFALNGNKLLLLKSFAAEALSGVVYFYFYKIKVYFN